MKNLIEIQNELKVPKGNYNNFGKYKYRSAEDILEAIKPLLKKYGAILRISDNVEFIGAKYFIKATATLSVDNDVISINGFAELSEHKGMSSEQCTGTASSYARKYALNGLFLIDETESDADSNVVSEVKKEPLTIQQQVAKAKINLKNCNTSLELIKLFKELPLEVQQECKELASELNKQLETTKK